GVYLAEELNGPNQVSALRFSGRSDKKHRVSMSRKHSGIRDGQYRCAVNDHHIRLGPEPREKLACAGTREQLRGVGWNGTRGEQSEVWLVRNFEQRVVELFQA